MSETHSESSAQKMTNARRLMTLVSYVSGGINEMMFDAGKGMYGFRLKTISFTNA